MELLYFFLSLHMVHRVRGGGGQLTEGVRGKVWPEGKEREKPEELAI